MPTETPEARAEREINTEIEEYAAQIANDLGPAAGADRVSDTDKVRMWGTPDPKVAADPEAFKQMLLAGQIPPELLEPNGDQALGIVRAMPEFAQILSQPLDEQMAEMVTRLAENPLRLAVLADLVDDPEAMVEESDRLDGLWQKQHVSAPVEASARVRNSAEVPQTPTNLPLTPTNLGQSPTNSPIPDVGAPVAVPAQLPTADLTQMLGG